MDNCFNCKMQAHARVCKENKIKQIKTAPIETILRLKVRV